VHIEQEIEAIALQTSAADKEDLGSESAERSIEAGQPDDTKVDRADVASNSCVCDLRKYGNWGIKPLDE